MQPAHLFSLEGKTALVTGGSRGIGYMIAEGLVGAGAKVFISSRNTEATAEAAAKLNELGEAVALPADISTEAGAKALAEHFTGGAAPLHILVNNAGANWGAPFEEYPDSAWDKVLATNVKSIFHLTRALRPVLASAASADDPARVINIGSIDGIRVPEMETYAYSTSKAAVHQLSRVLARKLAPEHITVNAIAPGPFESKMMKQTLDTFRDHIIEAVPLKRIGRAEDMGGIAVFLSSRAGAYITGAVIPVDGGMATLL